MSSLRSLGLFALAFVVLPLVLACGGDDEKKPTVVMPTSSATQDAAKAQLCQQLNGFKSASAQVNSLTASSTVDDTKKAYANMKASWEKVKIAASVVQSVKLDQLNSSMQTLEGQVNALPPNTTLSSAAAQIGPSAKAVAEATVNIHTVSGCPQS
jgi:hypothetical protein